jgi:hypothetical protein
VLRGSSRFYVFQHRRVLAMCFKFPATFTVNSENDAPCFIFLLKSPATVMCESARLRLRTCVLQRQGFHFSIPHGACDFLPRTSLANYLPCQATQYACNPPPFGNSPEVQSRTLSFVGYRAVPPQPAFPYSNPDRKWLSRLLNRTHPPGRSY